jgi:hypothetical protein
MLGVLFVLVFGNLFNIVSSSISSAGIPIDFTLSSSTRKVGRSLLDDATVSLCVLDWAAYKADPPSFPMFRDLLSRSKCEKGSTNVEVVSFASLAQEYEDRGCEVFRTTSWDGGLDESFRNSGCVPTGAVFHESRCGSTLVGNMLAKIPDSLVYSESGPPFDILTNSRLTHAEKVRALRIIIAAMGRPIPFASKGGIIPNGLAQNWRPIYTLFKFQSYLSNSIGLFREAFPGMPWAFVHRNGVEVLASLFRGANNPPGAKAPLTRHVNADDPSVRRSPCMRNRDQGALPSLVAVTGLNSSSDAFYLPAEEYCAASVAILCANALLHATSARESAFRAAGLLKSNAFIGTSLIAVDPLAPNDLSDGHNAFNIAAHSDGSIIVAGGLILDAHSGRGVIRGIGQGIMVDFRALPEAVIGLAQAHFGVIVSEDIINAMLDVSTKYSKARGSTGSDPSDLTLLRSKKKYDTPSMDKSGKFVEDSEFKRERAWPALRLAAARYLTPLRSKLLRFNPPVSADSSALLTNKGDSSPESVIADAEDAALLDFAKEMTGQDVSKPEEAPGTIASVLSGLRRNIEEGEELEASYDINRHIIPLGKGYPMLFPLSSILSEWSSDTVSVPPTYGRYTSLRVFDYATEREEALRYRRAEVPFVIRGIPSLDIAIPLWADDTYLTKAMNGGDGSKDKSYTAEVNENSNHFMYWNKAKAKKEKTYVPPTEEGEITPREWFKLAKEVMLEVNEEEKAQLPAWWFSTNSSEKNDVKSRRGISTPVLSPVSRKKRKLYYMRASTDFKRSEVNAWITRDLTFLDAKTKAVSGETEADFFVADETQQRGIHCRFGMPGIIAEAHYDGGRNFITMQRGKKRYILSPPSECGNLHLLKDGPSSRHSDLDWSDHTQVGRLNKALATEIIIEAGDALYVPALWFHYITSLNTNVQCNTRSGTPRLHEEVLKSCGFGFAASEELGKYSSESAAELQPDRSTHAAVWSKHWPSMEEVKRGALEFVNGGGKNRIRGENGGEGKGHGENIDSTNLIEEADDDVLGSSGSGEESIAVTEALKKELIIVPASFIIEQVRSSALSPVVATKLDGATSSRKAESLTALLGPLAPQKKAEPLQEDVFGIPVPKLKLVPMPAIKMDKTKTSQSKHQSAKSVTSIREDLKDTSIMTSVEEEEKAVPVLPPISAYKPLPQQEARAREAINAARDWAIAPKRKNNRLTSVRKGNGGSIGDSTESSIDYQVGLVSTLPSFLRGPSGALLVLVTAVFIIWWIVNSRIRKGSTRTKAIR